MPVTQQKCIYGGLTLDVDQHYIGSVTATTHQEKGIITLESNPWRGTVLPAPHGKNKRYIFIGFMQQIVKNTINFTKQPWSNSNIFEDFYLPLHHRPP